MIISIFFILIIFLLIFVFAIVFYSLTHMGKNNLEKLVQAYSTSNHPPANLKKFQTIQIDSVVWKNCTDIGCDQKGVYLKINPPFKNYPMLFFPWSQLTLTGHGKLYWQNTHIISIAQPPISQLQLISQDHPEITNHFPN